MLLENEDKSLDILEIQRRKTFDNLQYWQSRFLLYHHGFHQLVFLSQ
jgi:hypothetical protein